MHIQTLRGRILETILSLRFFIFQYGIVYKLHLTGDDTSLAVHFFSSYVSSNMYSLRVGEKGNFLCFAWGTPLLHYVTASLPNVLIDWLYATLYVWGMCSGRVVIFVIIIVVSHIIIFQDFDHLQAVL